MMGTKKPQGSPSLARKAGQLVGGFVLGLLLVLAAIEVYGQIGNLKVFEYQGY